MDIKNNKFGYTLAEVITVMIIIAIVVGISLRLVKAKLNNIKSYTYHYAYQILSSLSREMLYNFKSTDETYMLAYKLRNEDLFGKIDTINYYLLPMAQAEGEPGGEPVIPEGSIAPTDDGSGTLTCPDGYQLVDISGTSYCVINPATLPRRGQNLCRLFASYTNTITNSFDDGQECQGDPFNGDINGDISFTEMRPDIVLKNGMRIYNMNRNPYDPLAPLVPNPEPEISDSKFYYNDAGEKKNVDTTGYIVFVDIDGTSGPSTLWQDIFPFYITMAGKVIPAYKEDIGGSNKEYLSMGAYNETVVEGGRRINWFAKSVPFKEAACKSGYIDQNTPYCKTGTPVGMEATCTDANSDCRIQSIAPVKWFN